MPRRPLAALAVAAALLATPAAGAVAVRLSVEDLARGSDAVVRGRVVRSAPFRAGRRIWTEVEVRAGAVWRGRAPASLRIVVPGGVVEGLGMRVDGAPTFADGEDVVVFLRGSAADGWRVRGLAQGKFRVDRDVASNDLSGTSFPKSEVRPGERVAEPMSVAELERRVRATR